MKLRHLLLALATAALLPSSILLANGGPCPPARPTCDKQLARTISALEKSSWQAGTCYDVAAANALYAEEFIEVLSDGSLYTKAMILDDLASQSWFIVNFTMGESTVVRLSESSALILYQVTGIYDFGEWGRWSFDLRVTSTYAKARGQWKAFSYHESAITPMAPVE